MPRRNRMRSRLKRIATDFPDADNRQRSVPPTPETLRLVEEYAVEALQWMVDDRLAARVDATATRLGADSIGLIVRLYRQGVEPTPIVFDDLWNPWR